MKLQPQPAQILTLLILRRGEVVTRESIRTEVWGQGTFIDFENGLNKAVMKIREVLNDASDAPQYIETLPKIGYRFLADVEYVEPSAVAGPRLVSVLTVAAEEPAPLPPAAAPSSRRRILLLAAPVVAAGTAGGYWFSRSRAKIGEAVHLSLALPPQFSFEDVGFQGSPLAFSPDGSEIVVVAREGRVVRLYRRKLSDRNFEPVPGSEHARTPVYSADGNYLLFVSPRERQLKRIPVRGGVPEALHGVQITAFGIQQSEDGRLWFGDCGTGLVCRRKDGTTEPVTRIRSDPNEHGLLDREHAYPEVLPGGRKLIYTAWTNYEACGLQLIDLDRKTRTPLVRPGVTAKYLPRTGHLAYAWQGSVYSIPFDAETGELRGQQSRVLQNVAQDMQTGATFYAASSNGSLAYIVGRPQQSIGPRALMSWKGEPDKSANLPYFLNDSRISPDGTRICFTESASQAGGSAIWVFEIAAGRRHRVTGERDFAALPIWSPDGKDVIYSRRDGARSLIYRTSAQGEGEARQLTFDSHFDAPGAVSPDGRWLLYACRSRTDANSRVYVLDLGNPGSRGAPLVNGDADQVQPTFSPDGRWVAMVSSELSKEKNVVLREFANPRRAWKVSEGGGWQPVWSPDGRDLYFFDASCRKLMAAGTESSGGAPRIGAPRVLCAGPFFPFYGPSRIWDVHPDGKRFLVATLAAKEPRANLVEIVLNWDGTLPQRV